MAQEKNAGGDAAEQVHRGAERLREVFDSGRERAREVADSLQRHVEERPFVSVAIAFGLGIVVGSLIRRR